MRVPHNKKTLEQFIEEAKAVHSNDYDYSLVDSYVNNKTKVFIKCKKCGLVFSQTPSSHINNKSGCPHCAKATIQYKQKDVAKKANRKILFGVAVFDADCTCNGKNEMIYRAWKSMIFRCYSKEYAASHPTYKECTVCENWLTFSNFLNWANKIQVGFKEGYHLDKDLIFSNNKLYSPDTCCFVPREINDMIVKPSVNKNGLPIGVTKRGNLYYVSHGISLLGGQKSKSVGYFKNINDAFNAYKFSKEAYIKEVAKKYYEENKITKRVYNALMNYNVKID